MARFEGDLATQAELEAALAGLDPKGDGPLPGRWWESLVRAPALGSLAQRLGLSRQELEQAIRGAPEPRFGRATDSGAGCAVVRADWRSFFAGAFELVGAARGRPLLLLADEHVPEISQVVAEAWTLAGGADGRLVRRPAVRQETLEALLDHPGVGALLASGERHRIRELRWKTEGRSLDVHLRTLRSRAFEFRAEEQVERAAQRLAREAFGRLPGLGGMLGQQVTRAWIPEPAFSAFSSTLLAYVDSEPAALEPPRCPDPRVRRAWERAREEGLDEGATLLRGGVERGGTLPPLLFTNVEASMGLARSITPAPVLALLRDREPPGGASGGPVAALPGPAGDE